MKFDFSGWATRNNLKCSDGRVIMRDAFKDCDGLKVPLVWNHQHNDSSQVLGHALLENKEDGVYAYCSFNGTKEGQNAKELVRHGDVTALSIYANNLEHKGCNVIHGAIRELSLVLAGANPGAFIDNIVLAHSDEILEDEAIISFNLEEYALSHSQKEDEKDEEDPETEDEKDEEDPETEDEKDAEDEEMKHSEDDSDKTVKEVFNSAINKLDKDEKTVVYAVIAAALENEDSEGGEDMKHNVFEGDQNQQDEVLMHTAMEAIIADGKRLGSLRESFLAHAEEYGIQNIDWLFPDAKNLTNQPGFVKRNPDAWVDIVLNGVHHTPFSRIKMMFADLREDDARAKGYATKGKLKKEEVFGLLKRTVEPTTIYKKQKLDRDDIIDITDFDVVSWLKGEMRMMLDEEIARAILFGDGRSASSEDKIREDKIIPIVSDDNFYSLKVQVNPQSGEEIGHAIINSAVRGQDDYEGSGNTIFFTSNTYVTDMLLMEDKDGHRLYKDVADIALAMSVNKIVKVPASVMPSNIYGVIVDLNDYNVGADKGGAVNMFDDFDIDYNQQKYLIETRCSGALTKPFSAVVLTK